MFISKKMKYFMIVAQERSFKNASEKLFLSVTPVSKGVHDLEDFLGYKLFNRAKDGIHLTDKGSQLYKTLLPIFNDLKDLQKKSRNAITESITVGTDGYYFMGMNEFIKNIYDSTGLKVDVVVGSTSNLKEWHEKGEVDILISNATAPDECIIEEDFFDAGSDHLQLAVSDKLHKQEPDAMKLLSTMPLIQLSSTIEHPIFEKIVRYRNNNEINTPIFSMPEIQNITGLVRKGVGISFVSSTITDSHEYQNNDIVLLPSPIENLAVHRKFYLGKIKLDCYV